MRRTAALIAGGGPAGATVAIRLAQGGVRAVILERAVETQDAICGGFVSWRTLATLRRLGIEPDQLGGHRVHRLSLFAGARRIDTRLPAEAIGLSRRRLDTLLLERAAETGAGVERGVAIRAADGRTLRTADGATTMGDALFLATGKHELRGLARPVDAAADPAMGLRVRLPPSPALSRTVGAAIELHLFDRGYAGLVLQEDGSANLCMAIARSRLTEAGDPARLLRDLAATHPALSERLGAGVAGPIDAIANVPYGWSAADTVDGVFRLGDQAAVIPSLAGEGIGIALASGVLAADTYLRRGAGGAIGYQRAFARAARRPLAVAGMVRRMAEAPVAASTLLAAARIPGAARIIASLTRID